MKSSASILAIIVITAILSCSSCKKTDSAPANTPLANDSITTALTSGSWVVASLTQKKEDNTSRFAGYIFKFSGGGKLTASLNGIETQGTWSYSPAVTYYGSSSKEAISINLGADNLFRRISKTWNIIAKTTSSLTMDNPEILEDEHLQLQKQ
jgi:hypothetical protein